MTNEHWSNVSVSQISAVQIVQDSGHIVSHGVEFDVAELSPIFLVVHELSSHVWIWVFVEGSRKIVSRTKVFFDWGWVVDHLEHVWVVESQSALQILNVVGCLFFAAGKFFFNEKNFSCLVVLYYGDISESWVFWCSYEFEVLFLWPYSIVLLIW